MRTKTISDIDRAISYTEKELNAEKSVNMQDDYRRNPIIKNLQNVLDCLKQHKELMVFFKNIEELP